MTFYTDGKARPFTAIIVDGKPLNMPANLPQLFVPIYLTRESFELHTGETEGFEVELQLDGESQ
jgi:hypothetical protein